MRPCRPPDWVESNARHLPKAPAVALDLGCGRGRHTLLLLDWGYEVVAVDKDAAALAALQQRVPESARPRLQIVQHDLEVGEAGGAAFSWPQQVSSQKFGVVLVVNYLHRPLLRHLVDLLQPQGVLIYEAWAVGNEVHATPKDAQVLTDRVLRTNELLEIALPRCEVLGYSHGMQEDFVGRVCSKQMICARLLPVEATAAASAVPPVGSCELAALLSGIAGDFLNNPVFGRTWLHAVGAAPTLPFKVGDLLALLKDYQPAAARDAHLARMRKAAAGEGATLEELQDNGEAEDPPLRLWGASMVRRLPAKEGAAKDGLRTDTIDDDAKIREFLAQAHLTTAEDVATKGDSWTFVVNQLQGAAPCLRDLQHGLFCRTGLSGGLNGYLTPPGEIGKPPHVDDHDVLVVQQAGEKVWLLLDTVSKETAAEVLLREGDVLYLPQGVPHHARAAPGSPSMHIAVGLHRSPLSIASLLAALLTVQAHSNTGKGVLPTSIVEEMDSRAAGFAAFGGREHWLNQLLPAGLHLPLISALDPEDFEDGSSVPQNLASELKGCAQRLLALLRGGPLPVAGDAPGAARQRAMQQAGAMGSEAELAAVVGLPASQLVSLATTAFWVRREHSTDRHFAHHGPRRPPAVVAMSAKEIREASSDALPAMQHRGSGQVAALLRPGGTLRVNGYPKAELEMRRVQTEIQALEVFCRELFIELDGLIQARLSELQARTVRGRIMNVLGSCCSAICIYKIVMSSVNLLLRRGGLGDDPATRLLNVLLVHLRVPLDISYWVPVLSVIFVGYLAFANTRQFIQRLLSVFRMVSTSVTSNSLALLLSEIMAMYFSACVLLTIRFVPRQSRTELAAMVGELDLSFVHLHFDYVFLVSSVCSAAVFGLSFWLSGQQQPDKTNED